MQALAPAAGRASVQFSADTPGEWILARALRWVYDVRDDDARMRHMLETATSPAGIRAGFDRLRKHYPLRREASLLDIAGTDNFSQEAVSLLRAAGFTIP